METILTQLSTYGLSSWMIFILVLLIIVFYFFKNPLSHSIKNLLSKKRQFRAKDLKNHDIFNTCDRVRKEVHFLQFYTHGRFDGVKTKMCIDFTNYKIDTCKSYFYKILKKDIEGFSSDGLKKFILEMMNDMHETYIDAIVKHWLDKNIAKEDVDYIVHLFEKFRYDVIQAFEHRINSIFGSTFHNNNTEKLLAVFEMWSMGIDLLPKDLTTTFESLNGKFQEIKY